MVFVVWDFETHALRVPLQSLAEHPSAALRFVVPGLGQTEPGDLFRSTVVPGIESADRVVAVVKRPNANVGFEIGLALGLGKPVSLVAWGKERPRWLEERPFGGMFVPSVESASEVRAEIARSPGLLLRPGPGRLTGARTLSLCATKAEADACRHEITINAATWSELPVAPFGFADLEHWFADVERVVWTIAAYAEGSDDRDGTENTILAAIAGWFLGRELRGSRLPRDAAGWAALQKKLVVLRSESARQVVDVKVFEHTWKALGDYRAHLMRLASPASSQQGIQATEQTAVVGATQPVRPLAFYTQRAAKVSAAVFTSLMLFMCISGGRPDRNVGTGAALIALLAGASTTLALPGYRWARAAVRRSTSGPQREP